MSLLLHLPQVHFGFGSASELGKVLAAEGITRPLFVTDAGVRDSGGMAYVLDAYGVADASVFDGVTEPPSFAGVDAAASAYHENKCDGIVAIGGGSVIDTAKMACVLATHEGTAAEYSGYSDKIVRSTAPLIVLPTTSGSGSEVSPSTGIHPAAGLPGLRTRAPQLVARATICDPKLTITLPPRLTANTGLDALTHCIEGYLSPIDNPIIDAIALDGIRRIVGNLERAIADGTDRDARTALMMGALEGGISIGKGLGPAHALATAFSHWPVPHGLLAALSLPPSLELMEIHAPEKTAQIARAMGLAENVTVSQGFRDLLQVLHQSIGIPLTLRSAGCSGGDHQAFAVASEASPVNLTSPYRPSVTEYRHMVDLIVG